MVERKIICLFNTIVRRQFPSPFPSYSFKKHLITINIIINITIISQMFYYHFHVIFLLFVPLLQVSTADNSFLLCDAFGWTLFQSDCYKLFTGQLSFGDAANLCRKTEAEMVSLNSAEENRFIFRMVEPELRAGQDFCKVNQPAGEDSGGQALLKSFWIGYKRTKAQNISSTNIYKCSWTDGTSMSAWANALHSASKALTEPKSPWGPGQPSGTTDWELDSKPEECVHILLANSKLFGSWAVDGQWNDLECGKKLCGVICKKKAKRYVN